MRDGAAGVDVFQALADGAEDVEAVLDFREGRRLREGGDGGEGFLFGGLRGLVHGGEDTASAGAWQIGSRGEAVGRAWPRGDVARSIFRNIFMK